MSALKAYRTRELYGELMRRGEGWRYEWALHVVALSRAMRLLYHHVGILGPHAVDEFNAIQTMLGDGFNNGLVREAKRIVQTRGRG